MTSVGFTRPRKRLADGERACREAGFEPFGAPSLDPVPGDDAVFAEIEETLSSGEAYFTVFASITAVEVCVSHFGKERLLALLSETNVACTGSSTEKALKEKVGRDTDVVPEVYSGVGIAEEISDEVALKKVLLLRSAEGDHKIVDILRMAKAEVMDEPVYSMVPAPMCDETERLMDAIVSKKLDALLMTSPASFRTLLNELNDRYGPEMTKDGLSHTFKVAIGKPTAGEMALKGFPADALPEKSTFPGMLETVKKRFS